MRQSRRVAVTGFGAILIGILAFALFYWANFKTVEVAGPSMEPTFKTGQRVLTSRAYWMVGPIRMNDIVVVRLPDSGETIIKRVKGLPGDVLDMQLIPYSWKLSQGEYTVPEGTYYCLGDNRPVSQDSRDYGPFEQSAVLGKVVVYGTEPWLFGIGALALGTLAASGLAAVYDKRVAAKMAREAE